MFYNKFFVCQSYVCTCVGMISALVLHHNISPHSSQYLTSVNVSSIHTTNVFLLLTMIVFFRNKGFL